MMVQYFCQQAVGLVLEGLNWRCIHGRGKIRVGGFLKRACLKKVYPIGLRSQMDVFFQMSAFSNSLLVREKGDEYEE